MAYITSSTDETAGRAESGRIKHVETVYQAAEKYAYDYEKVYVQLAGR